MVCKYKTWAIFHDAVQTRYIVHNVHFSPFISGHWLKAATYPDARSESAEPPLPHLCFVWFVVAAVGQCHMVTLTSAHRATVWETGVRARATGSHLPRLADNVEGEKACVGDSKGQLGICGCRLKLNNKSSCCFTGSPARRKRLQWLGIDTASVTGKCACPAAPWRVVRHALLLCCKVTMARGFLEGQKYFKLSPLMYGSNI